MMNPPDTKSKDSPGGGTRTKGEQKVSPPGKPLVSVVTVVFNGDRHLEQAIGSVLAQSYDNIEFIVVDGGSTDGTLDIVRRFEDRIDRWISEPDRGIYDAMNKGIAMSTGDMIGFLNADDWYEPGTIEAAARAHNSPGEENSVIAGAWNLVFEDIGLTVRAAPSLKFHLGMPLSHQALFVPKGVYKTVGKYDLQYRYAADLDMVLRLSARGVRFRFLDSVLVNFRTTGASERHFLESGREASGIIRKYQPFTTWCLFKVLRLKFEALNFVSRKTEQFLGKSVAGSLKRAYYRLKALYSRNWRIPRPD